MVVVGEVGAGAGAAGGFDKVSAFVLAVMELDVVGVEFGQVFKKARAMTVLGVDEQIVLGGEWTFGHGVDGVRPHDYFGLVFGPAIGQDQVAIPLAVAEHHQTIRRIEQGTFFLIDSGGGRIDEQHVGTLDERQTLGVPPHRVAAILPVPEPGDRNLANG